MRFVMAVAAIVAMSVGLLVWPLRPHDAAADSGRQTIAAANALTFEIGEQALAEQANAFVAGRHFGQTPLGELTLDDVAVQLRANQVTVSGTAQTASTRVPIRLSATSWVQTGRVLVHVTDAQLGTLPVPEPMRHSIEQYIQTQMDQVVANYGAVVQSVQISQGKLEIYVRPS